MNLATRSLSWVKFEASVLNWSSGGIPLRFLSALFISSPAAFLTQTVCLDDTTVKFEIWDTAGQERYHSLAPMYYRGAQAAIVVYDITNTVSAPPTVAQLNSPRLPAVS